MSAAQLLGGAIPLKTASLTVSADASGVSAWAGSADLSGGTVSVTAPYLPANCTIILTPIATAVGAGNLAVAAGAVQNPGLVNASFSIYGISTDTRTVKWVAILN